MEKIKEEEPHLKPGTLKLLKRGVNLIIFFNIKREFTKIKGRTYSWKR